MPIKITHFQSLCKINYCSINNKITNRKPCFLLESLKLKFKLFEAFFGEKKSGLHILCYHTKHKANQRSERFIYPKQTFTLILNKRYKHFPPVVNFLPVTIFQNQEWPICFIYIEKYCRGSTYISYKSEARTTPVMYRTVVVSGTVARLFRYEDMVMNHAFIVLVSEIYNTIYSPPTRMCCITRPNNDDDDDD